MKYNFDETVPRRGTNSAKWDLAKDADTLPMWVADMDFRTFPGIVEALSNKVAPGIFGYSLIPEEFYDSVIRWWQKRHQYTISKEWLVPTTGLIPTLSATIRAFVKPGENIIVQPPVYNHFFTLIENCGCNTVVNNLRYEDGNYHIDFDDLELKAADPRTKLLLLCNPQNPVGRVWTRQELERIASIASANDIMVVSDEIHADLVYTGHQHIPFPSVSQKYNLRSVTCGSPCKTFNLSGLPISYIISQETDVRTKITAVLNRQETAHLNSLAVEALIAAYSNGEHWLEELKAYLYSNYLYLKEFCTENLPKIKVIPLQATYLVWLDCSALNMTSVELSNLLMKEEKLWLNPGDMYGSFEEGFLRINIACPRALLEEGLERLKTAYRNLD